MTDTTLYRLQRAAVTLAACLVFLALGGIGYTIWIDSRSPIVSHYAHPRFLACPARNRVEAARCETTAGKAGGTVWRYEEYSVRDRRPGVVARWWRQDDGRYWAAPLVPTTSTVGGPFVRNFLIDLPRTPGRWTMSQRIDTDGRLADAQIAYPPIEIEVTP